MKRKKYRAGKLFNKFLKLTLGNYMRLLFHFRMETGGLKNLKPPYLLLANHTNFWDPFLLSMCIPEPVYYVASDAYFRNPLLKRLLKLVGAIPKTKNISDPQAIRGILEVIRGNGVVGIFPEGRRNWDGKTLPLLLPTSKLIKALNIPVVMILLKGACLSMPRWADSTRKGSLVMELAGILEPQEIRKMNVDEIHKTITEKLSYSEYEYQHSQLIPYNGNKLAEKLERFLFCCPECGETGTLHSADNRLACRHCSYTVTYNKYGFFESDGQPLHFNNPEDWNTWQLEQLASLISSNMAGNKENPVFTDGNAIIRTGEKTGSLDISAENGTISLFCDRLEYRSDGTGVLCSFPLQEIAGLNIQNNNQMEFIRGRAIYRISRKDGALSAYKWVKAIELLKAHIPEPGRHTFEQLLSE